MLEFFNHSKLKPGPFLEEWDDSPGTTQVSNSPSSRTSADITKKAPAMLNLQLNGTGAMIVGCVHDEIILEAP